LIYLKTQESIYLEGNKIFYSKKYILKILFYNF
jgi:hypothetical protein